MRHNASIARDYDKKSEFASPDSRGGAARTASHRYLPAEGKVQAQSTDRGSQRGAEEEFSSEDFKARWWPAPDAWQ